MKSILNTYSRPSKNSSQAKNNVIACGKKLLLAGVVLVACVPVSTAEIILVHDGVDGFRTLVFTKYINKNSVLLFTAQLQPAGKELIKKTNAFILKSGNLNNISLDLSPHNAFGVGRSEISLDRPGVYEIFAETGGYVDDSIADIEIKVNGEEPIVSAGDSRGGYDWQKWRKIGEVNLTAGKHRFEITGGRDEGMKVVLVNKHEREAMEQAVWEKIHEPETEVCYIFEKERGEFYVPGIMNYH